MELSNWEVKEEMNIVKEEGKLDNRKVKVESKQRRASIATTELHLSSPFSLPSSAVKMTGHFPLDKPVCKPGRRRRH